MLMRGVGCVLLSDMVWHCVLYAVCCMLCVVS